MGNRLDSKLGQQTFTTSDELPQDALGLYAFRQVINPGKLMLMARFCGVLKSNEYIDDGHVTAVFSKKQPVDTAVADPALVTAHASHWESWVNVEGKAFTVLRVASTYLEMRYKYFMDAGCISDHPVYQPHVTVLSGTSVNSAQLRVANHALSLLGDRDIRLSGELFNELVAR